jgi:hypothetical protein
MLGNKHNKYNENAVTKKLKADCIRITLANIRPEFYVFRSAVCKREGLKGSKYCLYTYFWPA